jgi:hypothetical protein
MLCPGLIYSFISMQVRKTEKIYADNSVFFSFWVRGSSDYFSTFLHIKKRSCGTYEIKEITKP